jgi:hypothetical protein
MILSEFIMSSETIYSVNTKMLTLTPAGYSSGSNGYLVKRNEPFSY